MSISSPENAIELFPTQENIKAFIADRLALSLSEKQIESELITYLRENLPKRFFTDTCITNLARSVVSQMISLIGQEKEAAQKAAEKFAQAPTADYILAVAHRVSPTIFDPSPLASTYRLLRLAFLAHALVCYHPGGWIRYDRKWILAAAGLDTAPIPTQEAAIRYLHDHGDLSMKVVGSNQPIPCYKLACLTQELTPQEITALWYAERETVLAILDSNTPASA